jgi:hypothetical protein
MIIKNDYLYMIVYLTKDKLKSSQTSALLVKGLPNDPLSC